MNWDAVRDVVDGTWETGLGVDRSVLRSGEVHVTVADLGANDALSVLLDQTCILAVRATDLDAARRAVAGRSAPDAFTTEVLKEIVGSDAQVDGPSCHAYAWRSSFRGPPDSSAKQVGGGDPELMAFLHGNDPADWSESGFPQVPSESDPVTTRFWILREGHRVVAAGNLTEWRGRPADVGVLTARPERGRGLATRLVATMVDDALGSVEVVRYRALATNTASLAVARSLGFQPYGQNYRARRPQPT